MLYQYPKFQTGLNSDKYKEGYDQIDWGSSEGKPSDTPERKPGDVAGEGAE